MNSVAIFFFEKVFFLKKVLFSEDQLQTMNKPFKTPRL